MNQLDISGKKFNKQSIVNNIYRWMQLLFTVQYDAVPKGTLLSLDMTESTAFQCVCVHT